MSWANDGTHLRGRCSCGVVYEGRIDPPRPLIVAVTHTPAGHEVRAWQMQGTQSNPVQVNMHQRAIEAVEAA